jgi:50S ribosomal protein L16 3-hydroxylase
MPRTKTLSDRRLLGGLSPAAFLARHWQRAPLLIRGAVDVTSGLPDRDALFDLASRDDVESRLIATRGADWTLEHGPFDRLPRARRDWTLLVQGVNLVDAGADAIMRRFDFISAMRLDDVMMSYAVDGGGVGAHLDSYDVFLLQVEGRRRWRWCTTPSTGRAAEFVDGLPVKILQRFEPTDEAVLEPGDMLYLPPACAHEGTALGPCITASIGFRAPTWEALTQEFLLALADRPGDPGRFEDAGRRPTTTPAAIDSEWLAALVDRLAATRFRAGDISDFVGRHFSEPKAHVYFDPPQPSSPARFARSAARHGLRLDLRAIVLRRGRRAFVAGEAFDIPRGHERAFAFLTDRRALGAADTKALLADDASRSLLFDWWQHGWLRIDEPVDDRVDDDPKGAIRGAS